MLIIIGIMLTGMLTGYLLRNKKLGWIQRAITLLIWLLLFLLGVDVGGNRAIVTGLGTIGVQAAIITAGAVVGSIVFSWALWHFVSRSSKKEGGR
jgi:uncharacterized membrane protein YbjE (DUF340 family)